MPDVAKNEIIVVNIRLPKKVVGWIDSLVDKKAYRSRSELIRNLLREYVIEQREKKSFSFKGENR
ncbi:MAG TPA: ribbon-helix-helix domain-containing protein [Candidatus Woesearchaeota archaeon]|jgi:metal-responsive CopG/Arc/MetJ family transcriptional regulator|nr:ribbon-helix-helix domain-containing protein [Candidatus Woesearchaeota archaeon]